METTTYTTSEENQRFCGSMTGDLTGAVNWRQRNGFVGAKLLIRVSPSEVRTLMQHG